MNEASAVPLHVVQITDTHLYARPGGRLLGLDTDESLRQVVRKVAAGPRPDLVVATGDLAHDGSAAAYARLRQHLGRLDAPVYCLPGNHDDADRLARACDQPPFHCTSGLRVAGWQLLFLDSTVPGSEGGHLRESALAALERSLSAHPDTPTLIWLHHQPLPVGSPWLDTMAVDNGEQLFTVIDRHPQVRALIWGHVHQVFEQRHSDVRLLATPSTCIQFEPGSEDFSIDLQPPGYRWLRLRPGGSFETGVERLAGIPGGIDLSLRGY